MRPAAAELRLRGLARGIHSYLREAAGETAYDRYVEHVRSDTRARWSCRAGTSSAGARTIATTIRALAAASARRMAARESSISIVPANEASCEDLQTIFGTRGEGARCQCQRYKLAPREAFARFPRGTCQRLREQTDCGHPQVGHDQRPGCVSRRRACRLVRGRAPHRLRGPAAPLPRALGRARGGQDRQQRLGRDLLVHPRGLPQARRQPGTGTRRGGVRPRRGARAVEGYPIITKNVIAGGAPRRHRRRVRRCRLHRGQPSDVAPDRHARRLLMVAVYAAQRKPVASGRGASGLAGRPPGGSSSL